MIDDFMGSRQHFASNHLDNVLFQVAHNLAVEMQNMTRIIIIILCFFKVNKKVIK